MKDQPITAPPAEALTETDNGPGTAKFEVAEVRYDDNNKVSEVVLQLEDGRMVPAPLGDKLDLAKGDILKTSSVTVKHEGLEDGVPSNPTVTKVDR